MALATGVGSSAYVPLGTFCVLIPPLLRYATHPSVNAWKHWWFAEIECSLCSLALARSVVRKVRQGVALAKGRPVVALAKQRPGGAKPLAWVAPLMSPSERCAF